MVLLGIIVLNIRYDVTNKGEYTYINNMKIFKIIVFIAIAIFLTVIIEWISNLKIHKNIKRTFWGISILGYITFQVLWVYYSIVQPGADQGMVYGAAKILFNNGNIMQDHILEYFAFYKQNIGIVAVFTKLMQIFGTDSPNLLRYVNIVSNVFTVFGLYWIYTKINIKNKKNGLLFFVLILGFLPISLLSTWVYGDFIGLALAVWAIVFIIQYVKKQKIYFAIFSSLCMAFSIITRGNSLIILLAIVIYLLFTIKENKTIKEKLMKVLVLGIFIVISVVPNKILETYVSNKYELNDKKEKSVITYLYMGMSEGKLANGWYNDEINEIITEMKKHSKNDKTIENQTEQKLKERIKYLLDHPMYTMRFYRDKILSMWAEPTIASDTYNGQENVDMSQNKILTTLFEEKNWEIVKASQKILTIIIYAGSLICLILRRKNLSLEMLLLILVFLGGFSFHLLWEAKSRYIIPYIVILIPISVNGINELSEKIKFRLGKIKKLKEGEKMEEQ